MLMMNIHETKLNKGPRIYYSNVDFYFLFSSHVSTTENSRVSRLDSYTRISLQEEGQGQQQIGSPPLKTKHFETPISNQGYPAHANARGKNNEWTKWISKTPRQYKKKRCEIVCSEEDGEEKN